MELPKNLKNDIWDYCRANNITNIDEFCIKLIRQGFTIEKFGNKPILKIDVVEEKSIDTLDLSGITENPIMDVDSIMKEATKQLMIPKELLGHKTKSNNDIYGEK